MQTLLNCSIQITATFSSRFQDRADFELLELGESTIVEAVRHAKRGMVVRASDRYGKDLVSYICYVGFTRFAIGGIYDQDRGLFIAQSFLTDGMVEYNHQPERHSIDFFEV